MIVCHDGIATRIHSLLNIISFAAAVFGVMDSGSQMMIFSER